MKHIAFLFPGQGSQQEGMGLDFIQDSPKAQELYRSAQSVLGWSVDECSQEEKKETLHITLYTQPAIYVLSCVVADALQTAGIQPAAVAGHSAGEFAALTVAGAWDFQTGLRVIAERARLMHEEAQPGAMAAVLGLSPEAVQQVCDQWSDGVVQAANFNSPKQTVITGEEGAVQAISAALKEQGARRVVPLKVSGAFHSPLMQEPQQHFDRFLHDIPIQDLSVPWISNNTGQAVKEASVIRDHLVRQFCEPVRWTDCMETIEQTCTAAVEVGPGQVLTGLVKACCDSLTCLPTGTVKECQKAISVLSST